MKTERGMKEKIQRRVGKAWKYLSRGCSEEVRTETGKVCSLNYRRLVEYTGYRQDRHFCRPSSLL